MVTGGVKGIGALLTVWVAYIDKTFTPLIWALLLLAFIDILLNVHKEGQQFAKLGSAVVSIGLPTFVANNIGIPDVGKYLVAMMVIVYLQLVVPQFVGFMSKLTFSKDPATNKLDQAAIEAAVQKAVSALQADAVKVADSVKPVAPVQAAAVVDGMTETSPAGMGTSNGGA